MADVVFYFCIFRSFWKNADSLTTVSNKQYFAQPLEVFLDGFIRKILKGMNILEGIILWLVFVVRESANKLLLQVVELLTLVALL